jgi:hypothetical protein
MRQSIEKNNNPHERVQNDILLPAKRFRMKAHYLHSQPGNLAPLYLADSLRQVNSGFALPRFEDAKRSK